MTQDKRDSREWVAQYMIEHHDVRIEIVYDSSGQPDWVATQRRILSEQAGPGLTSDELLDQLDEDAHICSSDESFIDQVDSENWVRRWIGEHPGIAVQLV